MQAERRRMRLIEQFYDIFYTTLRECLKILGEKVVILVIFC